ncbi:hypothetical protein DICVIV_09681 [Dictyocaulus viviparus]|uniref:Uncharacterized protein n=1 Tax=Dictyocaulus viviparus TaxID=29172 RepID=A0A0D8XKC9_DICVI|nr:hypothetical protein DICVIV_09681 [Dictyocaulus viviparus]
MECPKKAAAVSLSIRMVESVGAKRQDVVFDMTCEGINELFPWINIPVGVSEMEREDCYYSAMFDPILDDTTDFSCKRREYLSGITRLTDTRIQFMCCRLRTREEFNCQEAIFNKPIGLTQSTIIENENNVINAIRIEDNSYVVRFCDLAPRNITDIYGDVKTTRRLLSTSTMPYSSVMLLLLMFNTSNFEKHYFRKMSKFPTKRTTFGIISTTSSPPRSSTTKVAPKIMNELVTKGVFQTTTITLLGRKSPEDMGKNENSVLEQDELVDVVEIETTKAPKEPMRESSTPSEISNEKSIEMTTSTIEKTTTTVNEEHLNDAAIAKNVSTSNVPILEQPKGSPPMKVEKFTSKKQQISYKSQEKQFKENVSNVPIRNESTILMTNTQTVPSQTISVHSSSIPITTTTIATLVPSTTKLLDEVTERSKEHTTPENPGVTYKNSAENIAVNDLSLITFNNEEFPKASEKKFAVPAKFKISKTDLPLKSGISPNDYLFLRTINSEGHRRAPIRTHRPHIDIWSSEENEIIGDDKSLEITTVRTARPRKVRQIYV